MKLLDKYSREQETETLDEQNEINSIVCCSENEPLISGETNMKITSSVYANESRRCRESTSDDHFSEQKKNLRKSKKFRKRLWRVLHTNWKWLKRGFNVYAISGAWILGYTVSPTDVARATYGQK